MRRVLVGDKRDAQRAFRNPWGLSVAQCYTLRLVCEHGGTKRAAYVSGENARNLEHNLMASRKKMGMFGTDIRLYLLWDRWLRKDEGELYE
jgi:hypothetical protein